MEIITDHYKYKNSCVLS